MVRDIEDCKDGTIYRALRKRLRSRPTVTKAEVDTLYGEIASGNLLYGGLIDWLKERGFEVTD